MGGSIDFGVLFSIPFLVKLNFSHALHPIFYNRLHFAKRSSEKSNIDFSDDLFQFIKTHLSSDQATPYRLKAVHDKLSIRSNHRHSKPTGNSMKQISHTAPRPFAYCNRYPTHQHQHNQTEKIRYMQIKPSRNRFAPKI